MKSLVEINGVVRDQAELTFPSTGWEYYDAFVLNGDVIEIDMAKAVDVKIAKLVEKVNGRIAKAEEKALKKALKGEDTTAEDAEVAKFKAKPKSTGVSLIANAATPEELDAITEDQVFV